MERGGWWARARAVLALGLAVGLCTFGAGCSTDRGTAEHPGAMAAGVVLDGPLQRIQVIGPAGGVPEALQVRFSRARFTDAQRGEAAGDALRWTISPAVELDARIVGESVVELRPKDGLLPGTAYTFALDGIMVDGALVAPPTADAWTHSFTTPEFGLLRASPRRFAPAEGVVEVDLRFTGAVQAAEVMSRLTLTAPNGERVRATGSLLADGRTVRLRITAPAALVEGSLGVALAAGVPFVGSADLRAPAADAVVALSAAPAVEVLAVLVKEGLSGFYFEVVCKDPSAGEERWYWDRDIYESWYVHERCMPDADGVAAAVSINPPTPFTVTPGPAGFRVMGEFGRGEYTLTIAGGMRTLDGGQLLGDVSRQLVVPQRAPSVRFVSTGRYLPRSAWNNLAIRTMNLSEVEVDVRHIPAENLVFWLSGSEMADDRTSNVVARTTIALPMRQDEAATHSIDLATLVPNAGQGVYEIVLRGGGAAVSARLVLTDHHIVAKRAARAHNEAGEPTPAPVWTWVRDVHTGAAVSGVELRAVRPSGQVQARCTTDGDGHCVLAPVADPLESAGIFAIVAQKGADLTFMRFDDLELQTDAATEGEAWTTEDGPVPYRAGLYADRGVYRPGEVVHVAGVLRDGQGELPAPMPRAVAAVRDARGAELRRIALTPDANGHFTADIALADFAVTGRYHVDVEIAERTAGKLSFNVEEFVPERMAVQARPAAPHVIGADRAAVVVQGRWLFGGSAAGSAVEASCRVEPARFRPAGHEGWHFGGAEADGLAASSVRIGGDRGVLDADGTATLRCAPATEASVFGAAQVVAEVAVMEGGSGRATRTTAVVPVHPAPVYLGLRTPKPQVRRGDALIVEGQVVDVLGKPAGAAAPAQIELEIFRLDEEVGWIWDDHEGAGQIRRSLRRLSVGRRRVPVSSGRFSFQGPALTEAAGWLVVATAGGARTELFIEGDANQYSWWNGETEVDATPRPTRPTALTLDAPDLVEVGADFEVSTTAPYAGWVLWTVEADRVLDHRWQRVQAGPIRFQAEVEAFAPNVYVSALLIKDPHLESPAAFVPGRAYGVRSVRVRPEAYELPVAVAVAGEARPWSPLEVKLDLGRLDAPATATVAVVDEGVLQLTRFKSPDLLHEVFAKRKLEVSSYETVGWTLWMEPSGPSSRTGGDAAGGSMGRVQAVQPVALWSGPVQVGTDGKASVKLDLPGYRGKLRVMVVAAAGARLGHAEASVVVRDPIVLQTTPPRVLASGDTVEVPVYVHNQTGAAQKVELRLGVEALAGVQQLGVAAGAAPVRVVGADRTTLALGADEAAVAVFALRADAVRGAARLQVTAKGGGHQSVDRMDLPVVPAGNEEHSTVELPLSAVVDLDAALDAGGWIDGADRTQVLVTTNPYMRALGRISDLIRYPYGCLEQTVSSTRPLLAVRALMPSLDADLTAAGPVDLRVRSGLDRVLSMQTPSGGFSYWPGGADPHVWASAYATHLLIDARAAGVDVPQVALDEALEYLARIGATHGGDGAATQAYVQLVLALGGRARPAEAQAIVEALPASGGAEQEEARYLAMAAVQLTGDRRHEGALRSPPARVRMGARRGDANFSSDLRRAALTLSVFEALFPGDRGGEALAVAVADAIGARDGRWYTTQELAWAVHALGKRVSGSAAALPAVALTADGATLRPTASASGPIWALGGATGIADLALRADGDAAGARVLLKTQGVRSAAVTEGGVGLALSRGAFTADGAPLDLRNHALGDRIVVRLGIENRSDRGLSNLAVVGRLPAGWELESARVEADPFHRGEGEPRRAWELDHANLRDDRVELFGRLEKGESASVWIELRATAAGRFTWPGMTAEAMYDPEVWAQLPGVQVEVRGPWTGSVL